MGPLFPSAGDNLGLYEGHGEALEERFVTNSGLNSIIELGWVEQLKKNQTSIL